MIGKFVEEIKQLVKVYYMLPPAIVSSIEVGLEKIFEIGFSCPCLPKWNAGYSACVFIIPALIISCLMLSQKWTGKKDCCERFLIALVPTVIWLIIIFLDGRYFVCSQAYGTGTFNVSRHAKDLPLPCNMKDEAMTENETLDLIRKYTATSQFIGAGISVVFALIWMIAGCFGYLMRPAKENPKESHELSQITR